MSFDAWLLFCATETVLCFTPGPAVLLVVSQVLTRDARAGLGAASGVLLANAVYLALSAMGVGAILVTSWELFVSIKWLGAAYLIWLGARMLLVRPTGEATAANATDLRSASQTRRSVLHGFVTQGANPKALLFFVALLPQFVNPAGSVAQQFLILGASSIAIEFLALGLYVVACRRARRYVGRPHFAGALNRAGGLLLIGAGAGLAALRRAP